MIVVYKELSTTNLGKIFSSAKTSEKITIGIGIFDSSGSAYYRRAH